MGRLDDDMLTDLAETKYDKGAAAVFIAFSMVMIIGSVAIAVDLGLGFNDRRVDQTSADTGVMSGAVEFVLGSSNDTVVTEILDLIRVNLRISYDEPDWRAMWRGCTDPGQDNFDVGGGVFVDFDGMTEPAVWGATQALPCISTGSSYLRVRVPDQIVGTTFARVIGFNTLTTHAAAVALFEPGEDFGGVIPFGIPGDTAAGEICLKTSGSGTAFPPCQGPNGGGFGEIDSEFFGDFFGSPPFCGLPGATELAQNVALGLDHFITVWSEEDANDEGVLEGSAHPGDATIIGYQYVSYDQCRIVGGTLVHQQAGQTFPVNTMRAGVGCNPPPIESRLSTNDTLQGKKSRLQQGGNPPRKIVKVRNGGGETIYALDNKGLWEYLLSGAGTCDGGSYGGLTTDEKVERIHLCLSNYVPAMGVIFDAAIADSPRFAWAPEYWHAVSTSGTSWQPVRGYRMVFVAGVFFNCSSMSCNAVFYPDSAESSEVCDPSGPSFCHQLGLDQLSAWLLPTSAVPPDVVAGFPGTETPFTTSLFK